MSECSNLIGDTGERRRLTDRVSTDDALELICSLAYENALRGDDASVIAEVERSIQHLRALKVQATGQYPVLTDEDLRKLRDES